MNVYVNKSLNSILSYKVIVSLGLNCSIQMDYDSELFEVSFLNRRNIFELKIFCDSCLQSVYASVFW